MDSIYKHTDRLLEEDILGGGSLQCSELGNNEVGNLLNDGGNTIVMVDPDDTVVKNTLDGVILSGVNDDSGPIECSFKRGVCMVHKLKGKKTVHKTKKWGKTKNGYGWIYSQTVKYSCPHDRCPV